MTTRKDIRELRKKLGLKARDITQLFDCTEQTVYKKEKPADAPADMVWYYALRWVEHRNQMNAPMMVDMEYIGVTE